MWFADPVASGCALMCLGVWWCILVYYGMSCCILGCTGVYWCVLGCTGMFPETSDTFLSLPTFIGVS